MNKTIRIALLSSCTVDILARHLENFSKDLDWKPEFFIAGFNQYKQEILNGNSQFYNFKPEVTILFLDGEDLFRTLLDSPFELSKEKIHSRAIQILDETKVLALKLTSQMPENILLMNTISTPPLNSLGGLEYNSVFPLGDICDIYNKGLSVLARENPNIYIVNCSSLTEYYGYKNWFDPRLWYLGRIRLGAEASAGLAKLYLSYLKAVKGEQRKCLVLDLDNTLWGGIIGEDGIEHIELGEDGIGLAYVDFQKEILNLYRKGIILSIASKNNWDDVKEMFDEHPSLVVKEKHFACIKVNWNNKVKNIKEIAAELNIGLDSLVFIDDNPSERELVKMSLPQVYVPEPPDDPAFLKDFIIKLGLDVFNRVSLTEEDKERGQLYKAQALRVSLKKSVATLEDFYYSLEMTAIIKQDDHSSIGRLAQLTQRTNQFNLTTRRYTENDIKSFLQNSSYRCYSLNLVDKFGSNGIVGLMILRRKDRITWQIDTFLLSCRIIGRTVEEAFMFFVINKLKNEGAKYLIGEFLSTKKNSLVKDLYFKLGFDKVGDNSHFHNKLELSKNKLESPRWIKIVEG